MGEIDSHKQTLSKSFSVATIDQDMQLWGLTYLQKARSQEKAQS